MDSNLGQIFVLNFFFFGGQIMAGLLDQYTLANNGQALNITIWMADYFNTRVQNLIARSSLERHYQTLNDESGGMNDALYKLYGITVSNLYTYMRKFYHC